MIIGTTIAIFVSFFIVQDLRRIREQNARLKSVDSIPDDEKQLIE